jgi:hypothetical protein
MKFLTIKSFLKIFFLSLIFINSKQLYAQTNVSQNPEFEEILSEKRKFNESIETTDRFKIQIFFGKLEDCKSELIRFKKEFRQEDATLVFSSPNYKVLVGNYKSKIEAEKNYNTIKKKFTKAMIIKPTK